MTDFLYDPGTNGFTTTPFSLFTTELNSLANNNAAVSSVGGSSGVFSQSNTGSAMLGSIWFIPGGAITPGVGFLSGWFLRSNDGGTTFEKIISNTALQRSPDFVIPLYNAAYSSGEIAWAQEAEVKLPFVPFKVFLLNLSAAALPSSGNLLRLGPVGIVRA